jgi:hypothetical protein
MLLRTATHRGVPDEIVSTSSELTIWAYSVSRFLSQKGSSGYKERAPARFAPNKNAPALDKLTNTITMVLVASFSLVFRC